MQSRLVIIYALLAALAAQCALAGKAFAIAAFSRQHKTECTTCHTIYPELNEYGEAFRKNGYVWFSKAPAAGETPAAEVKGGGGDAAEVEKLKAQAAVKKEGGPSGGGEKGKQNEGLWLAAIPDLLPVSFTASLDLAYDEHPANNDKLDLSARSLVLNAGGAFRDKAGFFATFTAYSQGLYDPTISNTPDSNKSNINELFLVWHHAFDTPLNLRVGRFQPQLTLWKKSNKLTIASFAPAVYKVGRSPFSIESTSDALELNTLLGNRVFIAGGIADRDGQNTKEGYGHISFKLGGADFAGHEPVMDLDSESIWDYLSVTFAAYGYFGRDANIVGLVANHFNNFYRAGADMDLLYKGLRIRFSGVKGRDTNPGFDIAQSEVRSFVLASEAEYMFDTNLIGAFRYEYQDDGSGITRRYIPTLAFAPLQNIKLTLEYKYEDIAPYAAASSINRITLLGAKFSF
ncbi:MAG TPA: hypothetical protein VI389_08665 [Geobacteraceae bacterium]